MSENATPGDIFAALYAAHLAGDYWVQTSRQAQDKSEPGWRGRGACARHVAALTACKALALGGLHVAGRRVRWRRAATALAADAATHYWADRRATLTALVGLLDHTVSPGKTGFLNLGSPRYGRGDNPCLGTGAYALDQAFHVCSLAVASVAAAGRP